MQFLNWQIRSNNSEYCNRFLYRKNKDYYEIIAGERRWRAAKQAGVKRSPCYCKRVYRTGNSRNFGLIENIQRENLNPIEEAMAFKRLLEEFNLKQDEVAERVSKSRTAVTNSMRLAEIGRACSANDY